MTVGKVGVFGSEDGLPVEGLAGIAQGAVLDRPNVRNIALSYLLRRFTVVLRAVRGPS